MNICLKINLFNYRTDGFFSSRIYCVSFGWPSNIIKRIRLITLVQAVLILSGNLLNRSLNLFFIAAG